MRGHLLLLLCLLSTLAGSDGSATPGPRGSRVVVPTGRGIHSFETIAIVTQWDSAGYRISPDFSGLDGVVGGDVAIEDSLNGSYRITYTTGAMVGLPDSAGITIPITATNPNSPDSQFTDRLLSVCRNQSTPMPGSVSAELISPKPVYHPGDSLIVRTQWRVDGVRGFHLAADYRTLVSGFREGDATIRQPSPPNSTYEITYIIPSAGLAPDGNGIPLTVVGTDSLCSEVRDSSVTINLRRGTAPIPREHRVLLPVLRGIREGDLVRIYSRWDSSGYIVRADFSSLDGSSTLEEARADTAPGVYLIDHFVQPMGSLPDDSLIVPIIATNHLGDTFTDRSFWIRRNRSTPVPEHIETWTRGGRKAFRGNDSLVVFTRWRSQVGLRIDIIPAYGNLVPAFKRQDATIVHRGADTTMVLYRTPIREAGHDPLVPDGRDIPLLITARDQLWGLSEPETLFIELDTTPPPSPPVFAPLPAESDVRRIHVSGIAPGADSIAIARAPGSEDLRFSFKVAPIDTAGHFDTIIDLDPGRNKIGGWSEDAIGNRTTIGASQIVRYVTERSTTYPTPYRPGDEIDITDKDGMREARVEVYNLEGERVIEMAQRGSLLVATFKWNGRDKNGDLAQPGYYLMRVRRVSQSGKAREELLPLLFRND